MPPLVDELNPNHPVTTELREQWHKLCAILMHKCGVIEMAITVDDIERFSQNGRANIVVMRPKGGDMLVLSLVSDAEASRLARQEGLPI